MDNQDSQAKIEELIDNEVISSYLNSIKNIGLIKKTIK